MSPQSRENTLQRGDKQFSFRNGDDNFGEDGALPSSLLMNGRMRKGMMRMMRLIVAVVGKAGMRPLGKLLERFMARFLGMFLPPSVFARPLFELADEGRSVTSWSSRMRQLLTKTPTP